MEFVDLETARKARGLRMVAASQLPSPWSEGAKGLFHVKDLPLLVVRYQARDAEQAGWTGTHNTPAVFFDDEPPRTGWADIVVLAERLGGVPLIPADPLQRAHMFGLIHELAGERGLGWCSRLIMVDGGLTSGGQSGFPERVSRYLAPKYGHTDGCTEMARARLVELFGLYRSLARPRRYLLGDRLTALDIYLATFLTPYAQISAADCPGIIPEILGAFAYLHAVMHDVLPPELLAHRAFIFEGHLPGPISL